MIELLFAIFSIFPVSFFVYVLSERLIARHESRVGRQIGFADFGWQTWIDECRSIRLFKPRWLWAVYFCQISILFIFQLDVEYLVFIYLALNGFVLAHLGAQKVGVVEKIQADHKEVSFSIAAVISLLCVFGCFTVSRSTSLSLIHWSWIQLFFVIPFQLAGMILFSEAPFVGMTKAAGWMQSARFYIWSMLCVKLFLGGGDFFFDLHLKSAVLYLAFRSVGIYFPNFQQRDLLRISILYLFPMTGVLWLIAMLLFGVLNPGAIHA